MAGLIGGRLTNLEDVLIPDSDALIKTAVAEDFSILGRERECGVITGGYRFVFSGRKKRRRQEDNPKWPQHYANIAEKQGIDLYICLA